jgi:hypothetical protein
MSEPTEPEDGPETPETSTDGAEVDEEVDSEWSLQYLGPYEYVDKPPTYMRPRFVIGTIALTLVLAFVMVRLGHPRDVLVSDDVVSPQPSAPAAGDSAEDGALTAETCPAPAGGVNLDAAKTIRMFVAATSGERFEGLQLDPEVEAQLGEPGTPAPLLRATRIQGFSTAGSAVSSCIRSWWFDDEQMRSSIDTVTVVPASKGWKVSEWRRGRPLAAEELSATQLAFYTGAKSCSKPDRFASVELPGATPDEQLEAALEELFSGTAGRATGAASMVPADVQVTGARVEGLKATVELTGTTEKMTRCQSGAAFDQIVSTASAVVLANLPPAEPTTTTARSRNRGSSTPGVEVEVLVDGQVATTLKP